MASEWIKALEEKERVTSAPPVAVVREDEPVDVGEDFEDEAVFDDEEETHSSGSDKTAKLVFGGLLGAVLVIGMGSAVYLMSSTSDKDEQVQAGPVASTTQQAASGKEEVAQGPAVAAVAPTSPVEIGNACSGKGADITGEKSVRGAVAAFEKAYFDQDAQALVSTLSKESPMRQQDWKAILPDAAPQGTTWCVEMSPVAEGASTVDVDLTMTPPGKDKALYLQKVNGEKDGDKWVITSMEKREG